MLKAILLSSSFISLLALTTVTKATVTATICNGCGPAALRQEALDEGNGDHYLYDFVSRRLTHYSIAGQTGGLSRYATIVPNSPSTQAIFNATQNVYDANGGSVYVSAAAQVSIDISSQSSALVASRSSQSSMAVGVRSMNAFDMVQTPVHRQMAINQVTSPSMASSYPIAIRAAIGTLLNTLNMLPLVKVPVVMQVLIKFPDGSTSIVEWDYTIMQYKYVEGSSRDAVGNQIPETPLEASGGGSKTYVFPPTTTGLAAGSQQISNMQKMGINIPTIIYGSSWIIACSNVAGGLPLCKAQPL